jgi:hypothetical protein
MTRTRLFTLVLVGALVLTSTPALAQDVPPSAPFAGTFTLSQFGVTLILSFFAPLVLGLIVRPGNPEWVKVLLGALVAGIVTLVRNAIQDDGTAVLSWAMFTEFGVAWLAQVAAYLGVWKPLDVNARVPTIIPSPKSPE